MAGRGRPPKKKTTETPVTVATAPPPKPEPPKCPYVEAAARGESWRFASKEIGYSFTIGNDDHRFMNCHYHTTDPHVAKAMMARYEGWKKRGAPPRFVPVSAKPVNVTPRVSHGTMSVTNVNKPPTPEAIPPEGMSTAQDPDDYVDKTNPDDEMFGA